MIRLGKWLYASRSQMPTLTYLCENCGDEDIVMPRYTLCRTCQQPIPKCDELTESLQSRLDYYKGKGVNT